MLDDAIEILPPAKLHKIAKKYFDLDRLRPDAENVGRPSLLADVKVFKKASLAGGYYESFNVNSRNFTQKSAGTIAWISEYRRLIDRCVINAKQGNPAEVREAMDILFGLLDHIDEGCDDVIFFADEGGPLAGRSGLAQGIAGLVQGSLGDGGARGVCQADYSHAFVPLPLWPRQDACDRTPNRNGPPTQATRRSRRRVASQPHLFRKSPSGSMPPLARYRPLFLF